MKKMLFHLLMLLCSVTLFTSCGSDEDVVYPIEKDLVGTYKGSLSIEIAGAPAGENIPKNISITKAGNNLINMELKDFVFMGIDFNTITISNCEVKQDGSTYTFSGAQTLTSLPEGIGDCPLVANGTIVNGKATVKLDITVPSLQGAIVNVLYSGTRLLGGESSEAQILTFTFDSDIVTEQPVINEATRTITFKTLSTATDEELQLTPIITYSEKASLYPASGVKQDFSNGRVLLYTVVAEDGTIKEYEVSTSSSYSMKFSFEEWTNVKGSFFSNEYDKPNPTNLLATSSEGAAMLKFYGFKTMPTYKTDDKKEGTYAIKLVTMDTSSKADKTVPAITSGSVFTGKFDMGFLSAGKLYCTRFGIPYDRRPTHFRGWYKYTPGQKFIDGTDYSNIIEMPGTTDQCSIQAVLFEVTDDADVLTGFDINNSDKRVAVASLPDGSAKAEYTYFNLPFTLLEGKSYNPEGKYKLAIVCASSKEGDFFKGAGGSTLFLDELEVLGDFSPF